MRHRSSIAVLLLTAVFYTNGLNAQIDLPLNRIVSQNFNSIGSGAAAALPANWKVSSAGTGIASGYATGTNLLACTQAASSGTPVNGGVYNWATTGGTDRAVGFMTSAGYASPNAIMAHYRNTTGSAASAIIVGFSIKRYVINTSTASVSLFSSTDGSSWTPVPAGDVATSEFPTAASSTSFTSPKTVNRTLTITGVIANNSDFYLKWVFTNTGSTSSQGLGLDNVAVFPGPATPVVVATLRDLLQVDNGTQNQFNEGDVIRYQAVVKNIGTGNANNVQLTLPTPPANTTMVPGSIKTSAVAVDDNYTTSFNTALNGSSVLVNDIGIPAPTAVISFGTVDNPAAYSPGAGGFTSAGGTLTVNANGTFTYTPPTGFSGIDQFVYVTGNGNLPNNDAVVSITVTSDISLSTTLAHPLCVGNSNGSITFNASGGNGVLTYSITGAAGTYQSSNIFTGLAAGTYNLAVKDAGGYIKTGTATLTDPAAIVVSGAVTNQIYNTAFAGTTFTRTGGTGAVTWSATGLPTGFSINASSGLVSGTSTQTGTFNAVITATDANGCSNTRNASFTVAPKLTNDAYTAVGNTQLVVDAHSTPSTPFVINAVNISGNDASDAAITFTVVSNAATTNGGTISIDAAGKFIYTPANGSNTADSYVYTGTSNGVAATATINFTVSDMIWYVNNTYGGGNGAANGSSHRPYTTGAAVSTAAQANQYIYVHTGTGSTTGNIVLKAGQTLRGAGNALSVGALSIAAGTKPTLSGGITLANSVTVDGFDMSTATTTPITAASATGVAVNIGNVTTSGAVNAVTLTGTTGTVVIAGGSQTNSTSATFAISGGTVSLTYSGTITQGANAAMVNITGGHATGTVTFQTGALGATNGTGLQFDNADGVYNFSGAVTLNGGDAGIDIVNGSSGNFTFNNTSITNPSGAAFVVNGGNGSIGHTGAISKTSAGRLIDIQSRTGGSVTLNGNLSSTTSATGINVSSCTGGTVTFGGGTKTISTGANPAITLATNTGATINFTGGGLAITTSTGIGINATGGGTISVAGSGNTITATTGTALNVANTSIGASGLTFQSIAKNGGVNGIVLNNTGTAGGLTITGSGGANSGGTIQNTTGDGISLISANKISLTDMIINSAGGSWIDANTVNQLSLIRVNMDLSTDHGILGNNVTNLTIQGGLLDRGGAGNAGCNIHGVSITNLLGTSSVTGVTFRRSNTIQFRVENTSATDYAGVADQLTMSGNNWNTHTNACAGDHLSATANTNANFKLIVNNSVGINTVVGAGIGVMAGSAGTNGKMEVSVTGLNTSGNTSGVAIANSSTAGIMKYNIFGNKTANGTGFSGTGSLAIAVTHANSGATTSGFITDNSITHTAGFATNALQVVLEGGGTLTTTISNNTITGNFQRGIQAQSRLGTGRLNLTINNNVLNGTDANGLQGINIEVGGSGTGHGNSICLNMFSNNVTMAGGGGLAAYRVTSRSTTNCTLQACAFSLQNFSGNGLSTTDVANWITGTKSNVGLPITVTASQAFANSAGCPTAL